MLCPFRGVNKTLGRPIDWKPIVIGGGPSGGIGSLVASIMQRTASARAFLAQH